MDTKILEQIGLTKSEINVYFALLELGTSSVGPILKKSKAPNSKIYLILHKLVEKGLVTHTEKQGVKQYNAESPNRILDYIESKKQELEKEKGKIEKIIPQMLQKQKKVSENTAKVFEGRQGLKSAYDDIIETLKPKSEMLFFSLGEEDLSQKWIQNFFDDFAKQRTKKHIKAKGIYPTSLKNLKSLGTNKKQLRESKYIDVALATGVVIYDSKVLLLDWKDLIAYMICSREISDKYKKTFKRLWATHK